MSSPNSGSTAPTITSPLLAWPSKPSPRTSPLTTPSSASFNDTALPPFYPRSLPSRGKGKGRAVDPPERHLIVDDGYNNPGEERNYPPPRKPLSPKQLGRIAQSFGIAIPSLPIPSPTLSMSPTSPSSSRFPMNHNLPTRGGNASGLITVIPPINLLVLHSISPPDEGKIRKWKRGRLVPMQTTMGGMLLAISREFGLPSTMGISLYLVPPGHSPNDPSSSNTPNGPLISSHTWSTLFPHHTRTRLSSSTSHPVSIISTPSHTPVKPSGPLHKDQYPPSPLSMIDGSERKRSLSTEPPSQSHSTTSSSSSGMPITPLSSTTAIPPLPALVVGTIEFDIDTELAPWLNGLRRTSTSTSTSYGHYRKLSSVSDGGGSISVNSVGTGGRSKSGIRELRLPKKVNDGRMRFLKELDTNRERSMGMEDDGDGGFFGGAFRSGNTSLSRDDSDRSIDEIGNGRILEGLRPPVERRPDVKIGLEGTISQSASFDEFGEGNDLLRVGNERGVQVEESGSMFGKGDSDEETRVDLVERVQQIREEVDKRGSGVVMAEQLDDLERIMQSLSPRDIRLTSPRMLTPRMAARVANANLTLPGVPTTRLKSMASPLASGFVPQEPPAHPLPRRVSSKSIPPNLDLPSWPAVPFGASPPGLPASPFESTSKTGPSRETLRRMKTSPPRSTPSNEWRPPRPNRPPSPGLPHNRTLSHTLSPELTEQIRSPTSSSHPDEALSPKDKPRLRGRAGSISLKGLKSQMSGKNLNNLWKIDAHAPMPGSGKGEAGIPGLNRTGTSETLGLFRGSVEGGAGTSFAGLRSVSAESGAMGMEGVGEFGQGGDGALGSPRKVGEGVRGDSLPGPGKTGLASRLFSFGRKTSTTSTSTATLKGISRRNPSISGPLPSSFVKTSDQPVNDGGGGDLDFDNVISTSPRSPTSPRSVKRKPVPGFGGGVGSEGGGLAESESIQSMTSFVLEDAPKRRVQGKGLGIGMGI